LECSETERLPHAPRPRPLGSERLPLHCLLGQPAEGGPAALAEELLAGGRLGAPRGLDGHGSSPPPFGVDYGEPVSDPEGSGPADCLLLVPVSGESDSRRDGRPGADGEGFDPATPNRWGARTNLERGVRQRTGHF